MKRLSAVLAVVVFLGFSPKAAAETASSISDADMAEITSRFEKAINEGETYFSLEDMNLCFSNEQEYLESDSLIEDAVEEYGSFKIGTHKEAFCTAFFRCGGFADENSEKIIIEGIDVTYFDNYIGNVDNGYAQAIKSRQETITEQYGYALSVVKDGMTDVEKALALHDYIATYAEYPEPVAVYEDGYQEFSPECYSVPELLASRHAVCCAYSRLYTMLLTDCGVEAVSVDNVALNHEWSLVKLDGKWYHVDCTWDDPNFFGSTENGEYSEDIWSIGAVSHTYFLVDNESLVSEGRDGYELTYSPHGKTYDKMPSAEEKPAFSESFFKGFGISGDVKFNYVKGFWYSLDKDTSQLMKTDYDTGESVAVDFPLQPGDFIKFVDSANDKLLVCTHNYCYRFDPETKEREILVSAEKVLKDGYFTEFSATGGVVRAVAVSYDEETDEYLSETYTLPIDEAVPIEKEETPPEADESSKPDESSASDSSVSDSSLSESEEEKSLPESLSTDADKRENSESGSVFLIVGAVVLVIAAAGAAVIIIVKKRSKANQQSRKSGETR